MKTTPRKFLAWTFSSGIAALVCLGLVGAILDFQLGSFPRLAALTSVSTPLGQALIVAGVASGIATVLVILLAATRGNLEFSALGVRFRGPSGPLLLWTVVFLAVAAVLLAALAASGSTKEEQRTLKSPRSIPFQTGWIFIGYYADEQGYIEGPAALVVFRPGSTKKGRLVPEVGDILHVRKPRSVVIAGYKSSGLANQMTSPALLLSSITDDDETGIVLGKGSLLIVRDVEVSHYPGRPFSVWCRIAECDEDTESCERAAAVVGQ